MRKKNIALIVGLMLIANQLCLADDAKNIREGELNQEQGAAPGIGNDMIRIKTVEEAPASIAEASLGLKQEATLGVRSDAIETKTELFAGRIAQGKLESKQEVILGVRNDAIVKPKVQTMASSKNIIAPAPSSFDRATALPTNGPKLGAIKPSSGKD